MNNIAIIPARSGSKGLPNKSILELDGKPLIAYTIDAAIKSNCFSTVMVSTDSTGYAEIAKKYGASVPFLRDPFLSTDTSSTWDTVRSTIEKYSQNGQDFDTFCVLQPTSPLRTAKNIIEAYSLYNEKCANSIVSVCELEHSLNICNYLPEDHSLINFLRNEKEYSRQMNRPSYRFNGAIYIANIEYFLQYETIYHSKIFAYIMSQQESVDIDTIQDFEFTEFLLQKKNK